MSITYNQSASVNSQGSSSVNGSWQDVGNNDLQINVSLGSSVTNATTGIIFNGANLQSVLLVSSQPVTLKVNSTSSPFATINLVANVPYTWSISAGYFSNPLNVNVTQIYATTTAACTIKGKVLTT